MADEKKVKKELNVESLVDTAGGKLIEHVSLLDDAAVARPEKELADKAVGLAKETLASCVPPLKQSELDKEIIF